MSDPYTHRIRETEQRLSEVRSQRLAFQDRASELKDQERVIAGSLATLRELQKTVPVDQPAEPPCDVEP